MISGYINQKITIYSSDGVRNPYGGLDPANTIYWETSAEVKQLRSSRTVEANQQPLQQVFQFRVRYRMDKNIQNNMLLYWRGTWFSIINYSPDVVHQDYVTFDGIANNLGNMVTT